MDDTPEPCPRYSSETSKHREVIQPFCQGYGLDIGFGGDPINNSAIRMDFPKPYANTGDLPVQLGGDCRNLKWIMNDSLDYVYSSHVLEDFDRMETQPVLDEWARVVRVGGLIVLLLPDQQRYLQSCLRRGEVSSDGIVGNPHHSIKEFSSEYVLDVAIRIGGLEKFHEIELLGEYSFLLVLRKVGIAKGAGDRVAALNDSIEKLFLERDALKESLKKCEHNLSRAQKGSIFARIIRRVQRMLNSRSNES